LEEGTGGGFKRGADRGAKEDGQERVHMRVPKRFSVRVHVRVSRMTRETKKLGRHKGKTKVDSLYCCWECFKAVTRN
jgi:hypothetical protein